MAWTKQKIAELLFVVDTLPEIHFFKNRPLPPQPERHLHVMMYYINPYQHAKWLSVFVFVFVLRGGGFI